ncbi:uncharacterized protein LOC125492871 [Beta vulgaris subsp. vulgaris]|uniref:uncharacterized protein LOC125492871 n=1 Tax=Beta vulgaris subsp. vulgaris TaxID=3555 RepID=UPI002036B373|nr:uncharacterized protein LOC125492871 [Beta vulgaris subsp. vulgaris]
MGQDYTNLCPGWCFTHNNSCHNNGRIVVGWWPGSYQVNIRLMNSQFIHCEIKPTQGVSEFNCTFVYGFNDQMSRGELWKGLRMIASNCRGPWVVMGDFNALSSVEDRIGAAVRVGEIAPMLSCINDYGLADIKATERHFTWNNKQDGLARVYSRIDRGLATTSWMETFELAEVVFLPEGNFDYAPALLSFYPEIQQKQPFRFCNYWCNYLETLEAIQKAWRLNVDGSLMFRVVEKIKEVKKELRALKLKGFEDVECTELRTRAELESIHHELYANPSDASISSREKEAREKHRNAQRNLNAMLQQRAKITWLKCGDENTKGFYQAI